MNYGKLIVLLDPIKIKCHIIAGGEQGLDGFGHQDKIQINKAKSI